MFVTELTTNRKMKCEKGRHGSVFLLTMKDKLKAVAQELGHEVRVFSSQKFAAIPSKLPRADQGIEKINRFCFPETSRICGSRCCDMNSSCRGRWWVLWPSACWLFQNNFKQDGREIIPLRDFHVSHSSIHFVLEKSCYFDFWFSYNEMFHTVEQSKMLKTHKMREAELAEQWAENKVAFWDTLLLHSLPSRCSQGSQKHKWVTGRMVSP
jgi:hypothetical protein